MNSSAYSSGSMNGINGSSSSSGGIGSSNIGGGSSSSNNNNNSSSYKDHKDWKNGHSPYSSEMSSKMRISTSSDVPLSSSDSH